MARSSPSHCQRTQREERWRGSVYCAKKNRSLEISAEERIPELGLEQAKVGGEARVKSSLMKTEIFFLDITARCSFANYRSSEVFNIFTSLFSLRWYNFSRTYFVPSHPLAIAIVYAAILLWCF